MRGIPLYVYYMYIHFDQYTHPMGSGLPRWAAGEWLISLMHARKGSTQVEWGGCLMIYAVCLPFTAKIAPPL